MNFVSYAQNFEDVMLRRALREVQHGFFIDVGAGEPEADSVTRAFKDLGWRGVNVEPVHETFLRLRQARPDDINLRAVVAASAGERRFWLVDGGNGLSTMDPGIARQHVAEGRTVSEVMVPALTLAWICRTYVDQPIHFLKIDVEGAEREVLEGADFASHRPWIVLVEATRPASPVVSHAEWEPVLLQADYRFVHFDGLNRYYLAAEHDAELRPRFTLPPNVFDGFVRAEVAAATRRAEAGEAGWRFERARADRAEAERDEARASAAAATQRAEAGEAGWRFERARADQAEAERDEARASATAATQRAEAGEAGWRFERARADQAEAERDEARASATVATQRAEAERDAYQREGFATGRHAAWLTHERQNLLDRLRRREAEMAMQARAELALLRRQHDDHLREIHASTSWRISAPVRAVRRLLRRRP